METHPVPQNISSYEFRLVGDMTLKQFLQLAGGTVLAIVAYNMPVPGIIKYPLTFLFALVGVLLAFVPINNRPFSQWLWAFFKAVYSPTEYVWLPTVPALPTVVQPTTQPVPTSPPPPPALDSASANTPTPAKSNSIFSSFKHTSEPLPPLPTAIPEAVLSAIPVNPSPSITPSPEVVTAPPPPSPKTVFTATPTPEPKPSAPNPTPVSSTPIQILSTPPITTKTAPLPSSIPPTISSPQAIAAPTIPNVLAGIISTSDSKFLEGVTVEIIDSSTGIPARALRSNRLGQFQIAIPLASGSYIINAEKEGYFFDPVSIEAKNALIPPVTLIAKSI